MAQRPIKKTGASKKGRGDLSGDYQLEREGHREGHLDLAAATAKGKIREAGQGLEQLIEPTKDKASPDANGLDNASGRDCNPGRSPGG